MDISLWLQLGTLVVAMGGVAGGLLTLRQGNRQQMLELGNLYIKRYWEIDDDLLILTKDSAEHRRAQHRYLRLCEDEFEAASRKWLDPKQWVVWHAWLTTKKARNRLDGDLLACSSDPEDFERVRACLRSTVGHDWWNCEARESNGPEPRPRPRLLPKMPAGSPKPAISVSGEKAEESSLSPTATPDELPVADDQVTAGADQPIR